MITIDGLTKADEIDYKTFSKRMRLHTSNEIFNDLKEEGFFLAPASRNYHGSYEGGLYDHSTNVMETLVRLTKDLGLQWQEPRSPYIIGMYHNLCKIDMYRHTKADPTAYEHNPNLILKGHGDKSVMLLSKYYRLTTEEILCIRYHMGAYETESWSEFDKAIKAYPNVLWTHTADMIASKIIE